MKKKPDQDRRVPAAAVLNLTITGPLPGLQAFVDATQDSSSATRRLIDGACYVQNRIEDLPDNLVLVGAQSNANLEWLAELSELHPALTIAGHVAMLARDPQVAMSAEFEKGQRVLGWREHDLDELKFNEIRSGAVLTISAPIQADVDRIKLGAAGKPEQIDAFVRALLAAEPGSPLEALAGRVVAVERPAPGHALLTFDAADCDLSSDAIEEFYRAFPTELGRAQILSADNRGHAALFRNGARTTRWLRGIDLRLDQMFQTSQPKTGVRSSPSRGGGR